MATVREVKEETGLNILPHDIEFAHLLYRVAEDGDHERVDIGFKIQNFKGEPDIMEPDKCDGIGWFGIDELPNNTIPLAVELLKKIKAGIYYSEQGFNLV